MAIKKTAGKSIKKASTSTVKSGIGKKQQKVGGLVSKVATAGKSLKTALSGQKAPSKGGYRRRRITPQKLMNKILILRLQKKLMRLKYGGR